MKKASETNEHEILDESHLHHGEDYPWGVFGSQRMTPSEILEAAEEGEPDRGDFGAVLMAVLDLTLGLWPAEQNPVLVGKRAYSVAVSVHHRAGKGFAYLGAQRELDRAGSRDEARRVLDFVFQGASGELAVGKRLVTVGKFLGHGAVAEFSMSDLGRCCGETPQAMQERVEAICEAPLRFTGSEGKAVWQQGRGQRERSAEAQRKHYAKKKNSKRARASKRAGKKKSN